MDSAFGTSGNFAEHMNEMTLLSVRFQEHGKRVYRYIYAARGCLREGEGRRALPGAADHQQWVQS